VRRRRKPSTDIVATPEAVLVWLAVSSTGKDGQQCSPLSCLNGFQNSVVRRVLSYTASARFPCDCCGNSSRSTKEHPGNLIFCCKTKKRYYRLYGTDQKKKVDDYGHDDDDDGTVTGQYHDNPGDGVPDRLIRRYGSDKILFASEDVHVWRYGGSMTTYKWGCGEGMSNASPMSVRNWYVVCTESGFYSPTVRFRWHEFDRITKLCTNIYHYSGRKRDVTFEKISNEETEDSNIRHHQGICFSVERDKIGSLLLNVIRTKIRAAYLSKTGSKLVCTTDKK